ncbi:MAG: hypothetical protein MUE34_08545 [Acidimicrobiales bacterium]|jgi:hypothetical protein|nr:hypothetical protein [Acidimicrobiales bacterium]
MTFRLVDPRGLPDRAEPSAMAPRPGIVPDRIEIGFLINEVSRQSGPDFTRYSLVIEEVLRERFARVDVVRDAKPVLSRPAEHSLLDRYKHCRGVVTGLAK